MSNFLNSPAASPPKVPTPPKPVTPAASPPSFKTLIVNAFMPLSLKASVEARKPQPVEDAYIKGLKAARANLRRNHSVDVTDSLTAFIAAAINKPEINNIRWSDTTQRVYDPTTILLVTKPFGSVPRNWLLLTVHGIDRLTMNSAGDYLTIEIANVRLADEIEVAAFYGALTPGAVRALLAEPRFSYILEPLMDPSVEVVEEPLDELTELEKSLITPV